jgi:hypothetical protein
MGNSLHREIANMVRIGKTQLAAMVLLCFTLMTSQSQADFYKFSGVLPLANNSVNVFDLFTEGSEMHNGVNPGDSWTILAEVDLSAGNTADPDDFPGVGWYSLAILNAELSFSSGYSVRLTPDPMNDIGDVIVNDNVTYDGYPLDSVGIDMLVGGTYLSATIYTETELGVLDSIALPTAGTEFVLDTTASGISSSVLNFFHSDGGYVSYFSTFGETFQAVPEPSTITLWGIAALGFCGVWWRKRRVR